MLRLSTAVVNRRSLLNWRGGGREVGVGGCHPCWAQVWKIINREFSPGLTVAATSVASPPLRRRRKSAFPFQDEDAKWSDNPDRGGLREAFQPTEVSFDEYIKTVSLSPWVPVPDVVARKMLDIAQVGPEDIHLELGSGDGRVNFLACDQYKVKKSTGIDVDSKILSVATERLSKRHPKPEHLSFRIENLVTSKAWLKDVQESTVITMYFITEALIQLRPLLEEALTKANDSKICRIVCCGYAMPGWKHQWLETILDLPIYMYVSDRLYDDESNVDWAANDRKGAFHEFDQSFNSTDDLEDNLRKDDGVELIELPLFDLEETIDDHWDDFDSAEPIDMRSNTTLNQKGHPK